MSSWKQHLFAAPGFIVSLLPKFACPICASASLGVLSSLGLGYLLAEAYLLPITVVLLLLALAALALRARTRQGYGPLLLGAVAAVAVLLGKFKWESAALMYSAAGLLLVSSLWNAWPQRSTALVTCRACQPEDSQRKENIANGL